MKPLPHTAVIRVKIIDAELQGNEDEQFIEFALRDSTGTRWAMASTYLLEWIKNQYPAHSQVQSRPRPPLHNSMPPISSKIDSFFNEWENRKIGIKMELQDTDRLILHELDIDGEYDSDFY